MLKTISFALVAAGCIAGSALAADRAPDTTFLHASRCAGLLQSAKLGPPDGEAIKAYLKAQRRGRNPAVLDMGEKKQRDAGFEAGRADADQKAKLLAEREGVCKTYSA